MAKKVPTLLEINKSRHTRVQLAEWGISWPPSSGWLKKLKKLSVATHKQNNGTPCPTDVLDKDTPQWLAKFADDMRDKPTKAERKLGERLVEELESCGLTVLQQFPVDRFILDVFIPEKLLAIEVDGPYHYSPQQWDKDFARTCHLWKAKRIRVIRFDNEEIHQTPNAVMNKIMKFCAS